jgi:hypothetical protein
MFFIARVAKKSDLNIVDPQIMQKGCDFPGISRRGL